MTDLSLIDCTRAAVPYHTHNLIATDLNTRVLQGEGKAQAAPTDMTACGAVGIFGTAASARALITTNQHRVTPLM
jgi:hypothetical protein